MGIFSKGAQTRIDETIAYIMNDTPPNERETVRQYIDREVRRMQGDGPIRNLSGPMSMNDLEERGTADERKKRRSLILMSYCRANNLTLVQIKAIGTGALGPEYFNSIRRMRLLANQELGNGALVREQYDAMLARPLDFLTNNMLFTRGSNTDGRMRQFFFYEVKNGVAGYALSSNVDPHPAHAPEVDVVSVPGVLWSAVPNRGNVTGAGTFADVRGTHLTGANLMITTQFSGCSFCAKRVNANGEWFAAHIMPGLEHVEGSMIGGGGRALAEQLAGQVGGVTAGNFAAPGNGAGVFNVYGSGYSNIVGHAAGYDSRQQMTLIGVLGGGAWHFYRQLSANRAVTSAVQIL